MQCACHYDLTAEGKLQKQKKKKSLWGKLNEIQGKHQEKSDNDEMPMHDIFLF